jgi:hypothetical protein
VSVGDGERITTRVITRIEIALKVQAPEPIRCVTSENGSEYGVVRRFFRLGLVKPARWRMFPNVLAAGQSTFGSSCSRKTSNCEL